MIKTDICDLLGIKYPIVQAPMGPFNTQELAVAVTNAGGFGMVSHPVPDPEYGIVSVAADTSRQIEVMKNIKDKFIGSLKYVAEKANGFFGVNLRVSPIQYDVPVLIDSLLKERENNPDLKEKLKLIITSAGDPGQRMFKKFVKAGLMRFHTVPSLYHAKKAEQAGVDGIVITGYEAGGHVAREPYQTFVIVPEVVKSVNVPVLGGGGVCDGKGLVAMLAFGAQGIYMGTRFIATKECEFHDNVKQEIINSSEKFKKETPSIVTQGVYGPLRHLKNKFSLELFELTKKLKNKEITIEDVWKYESDHTYEAKGDGDVENGAIWAGQVSMRLHEIPTCKELIESIMKEAEETLKNLSVYCK
ncbi:MAG: NAD(P)H-dependent flavin oxidoreductase [Candidatus Hodarchaeota archaeon]